MHVSVIRNVLHLERVERYDADAYSMPIDLVDSNVVTFVNGEVWRSDDLPVLGDKDFLTFVAMPGGPGAILILKSILIAAAISFAISKLFPPPKPEQERNDESSSTYDFQGIGNNRTEGLPVQVIYGRHRVGGQVIGEFVKSRNIPSVTDLHTLLAFGEGPIKSILGIETDTPPLDPLTGDTLPRGLLINDNDAADLSDIFVHIRLGENTQLPIEGFFGVRQPFLSGARLTQEETGNVNGSIITTDDYGTGDDSIWDEFAVTVTISTQDSDGFVVRFAFPQGLWFVTSSGSTGVLSFHFQLRYRALDGALDPITIGGPNNDGWVRLTPEAVSAAQRSPFDFEVERPWIDPQTWQIPVFSDALILPGSGGAFAHADRGANLSLAVSPDKVHEISVVCWVRFDNGCQAILDAGGNIPIVNDYTQVGGPFGWSIELKAVSGFPLISRWTVRTYDGTVETTTRTAPGPTDIDGQYLQIAFTYAEIDGESDDRIRMYINGVLVINDGSDTLNMRIHASETTGIHFGTKLPGLAQLWPGRIDTVSIYREALASGFIRAAFNAQSPGPAHASMIAQWLFDVEAPSDQSPEATGLNEFEIADLEGTASISTTGLGLTFAAPIGDPLRGKFQLQVLRINQDSDNTNAFDDCDLESVDAVLEEKFAYPNVPLAAIVARATEQISGTKPKETFIVEGRSTVPVWDGFAALPVGEYSSNPAWVFLDQLTHKRYGLGQFYTFASIVPAELRAWADYCDDIVYDGKRRYTATEGAYADIVLITNPLGDGLHHLLIIFLPGFDLPEDWHTPDKYLRFVDINNPTTNPTNVHVDIALGNEDGYLIQSIGPLGDATQVNVIYGPDTLPDPWTGVSGSLAQAIIIDGPPNDELLGNIEGGHKRFSFDGVFDRPNRSAWDSLLDVCAVGLGTPMLSGSIVRVRFARPRSPVGIVSVASIEKDSFEINYSDPREKDNNLEIGFIDEALEWERSVEIVHHSSLVNASSADDIRKGRVSVFGETNRTRVNVHGQYILNSNALLNMQGTFKMGPEGLPYEAGDILIIAHDILPTGVSGRCLEDLPGATTTFKCDRDITLEVATVYFVYYRHPITDEQEKAELDLAVTPPGDYTQGQVFTVKNGPHASGGFTRRPSRNDTFIIVADGDELTVEITNVSLGVDLVRTINWIQYDEDVWTLQDPVTFTESSVLDPDPSTSGSQNLAPASVTMRYSEDRVVRGRGGSYSPILNIAWEFGPLTEHRFDVAQTNVYVREHLTQDEYRLVGTAFGSTRTIDVPIVGFTHGDVIEIVVQPITTTGFRSDLANCGGKIHAVMGLGVIPPAPTNFLVEWVGDGKVKYAWTLPEEAEDCQVEVRRGGWITAPLVFTSRPGELEHGPTDDWCARNFTSGDPLADETTRLYARCRNSIGMYSDVVTALFIPDIIPIGDGIPPYVTNVRQDWQNLGDGWVVDTTPPVGSPVLNFLNRHADGYLEFGAAIALQGVYTTSFPEFGKIDAEGGRPRKYYVEACVQAEQVHPLTWDDAQQFWSDWQLGRWTWEGPTTILPGESLNVRLRLQARMNMTGDEATGWTEYSDFTPGTYSFIDIQWRLIVTRPNATYDIKIHRLHTRVSQPLLSHVERPPMQALFERETYGSS